MSVFKRFLPIGLFILLPTATWAQNHPCLDLLKQAAQAGVAAKVCQKQVNMDTLTALHQQLQCAPIFAQKDMRSQIATLANQASSQAAQRAQQLGDRAYCQQASKELGALLK